MKRRTRKREASARGEGTPTAGPVWLRVAFGLGVVVAVLVAAGIVSTVVVGNRSEQERVEMEARLDASDPNWRLADLERTREEIPDHENSARVVVDVSAMLRP